MGTAPFSHFLHLHLPNIYLQKAQKMAKGTKRGSPGAEAEKSPLADVELSDEDAAKLTKIQRDLGRAELILGESQLCPNRSKETGVNFSLQNARHRLYSVLYTKNVVKLPRLFPTSGRLRS